ncbi:rtr1/RPAP2 family protein [Sarocladium implicatum]|nr:rtr1/RPAP2 family protein [Sarocladium implicatum]
MDTPPILKGILKDRSDPRDGPANPRETAVAHAKILQHRKDLEAQILASVILLSEYPRAEDPSYTASNPAPSDVTVFKQHVRLFQPSDYDDLIEERNVNELCGYTLCGNERRTAGRGGEWKISRGQIVKKKDLEMWCSPACAKRAMYVKVQLNETAAWERVGIPDIQIELLEEGITPALDEDKVAQKMQQLKLDEERQAASDQAALELERGQPAFASRKPVLDNIKLEEKEALPTDAADAVFEDPEDDHLAIEGYKSKMQAKLQQRQ